MEYYLIFSKAKTKHTWLILVMTLKHLASWLVCIALSCQLRWSLITRTCNPQVVTKTYNTTIITYKCIAPNHMWTYFNFNWLPKVLSHISTNKHSHHWRKNFNLFVKCKLLTGMEHVIKFYFCKYFKIGTSGSKATFVVAIGIKN